MAYAFNDDKSKFDLDNLVGNIATIETSPVVTSHSAGEYIMYNGTLFKVLSPIATGENLVLGTNVTPVNFGNEIKALQDSISWLSHFGVNGGSIQNVSMNRYGGTDQQLSIVFRNESKEYNFAISEAGLWLHNNTDNIPVWFIPIQSLCRVYDRSDGTAWQMQESIEGTNISFFYDKNARTLSVDMKINGTWIGRRTIASW